MVRRLGWFILLGGLLGAPASAEVTVDFCVGEDPGKCPVPAEAFYTCEFTYEQAAADICTIYADGQKTVSAFRILRKGTAAGGACGYAWAQAICMD